MFNTIVQVYNEYLLKTKDVNFWVQNIYFYVNSILFNLFFLAISSEPLKWDGMVRLPVICMAVNLGSKKTIYSDSREIALECDFCRKMVVDTLIEPH